MASRRCAGGESFLEPDLVETILLYQVGDVLLHLGTHDVAGGDRLWPSLGMKLGLHRLHNSGAGASRQPVVMRRIAGK